jgi:hypothetical protein
MGVDRASIGALSLLLLMAAYLTALVQGGVGLAAYRLLIPRRGRMISTH